VATFWAFDHRFQNYIDHNHALLKGANFRPDRIESSPAQKLTRQIMQSFAAILEPRSCEKLSSNSGLLNYYRPHIWNRTGRTMLFRLQ
jgi:hypothetical protein